jgi:hypothetical protein
MNCPAAPRPVATGIGHGPRPEPEHAARAVKRALARGGLERASAVLLFLTPHYARDPQPALTAAARAAQCTQVLGATAAGVLTDEEWRLDSPGAAAMVFAPPLAFAAPSGHGQTALSLCTPAGLSARWLDEPLVRLGAVSADLAGEGPFCVWQAGRPAESGCIETAIAGARAAVEVSQGLRALTAPIEVAAVRGADVLQLGHAPALSVLMDALPPEMARDPRLPLHLLMGGVTFGEPASAVAEGRYRLNHIVAADFAAHSITLAQPLAPGERLFWAMRDRLTAERDLLAALARAEEQLAGAPDFALLFPCVGRGPHFYGNRDRDLELLKERHPRLPVIGFYGNGEIAPLAGTNHLYQYSAAFGLFQVLDA